MYSSFCFLHPKPSIHLQVKNWAAKGSNNFSCHLLDVNEARHYFSQAFKTLTVFFLFFNLHNVSREQSMPADPGCCIPTSK